jgi:hypothetical protein
VLTDEQIVVLDEVFRSGDVHASLLACVPSLPVGDTPADRGTRVRYWQALRTDPSAKEYLAYLREDALAHGGVTLGEHIGDLRSDVIAVQGDIERLRRILGQTPGAPSALASLHGTIAKDRELQAKASGLHARRDNITLGDDDSDTGAKVRGVRVEWV